ncbi:MAG: sporulation protein, partial [Actinobacteria bacterium]|nr:sporulation protein [Actinomycetota bacterium]
MEIHELLAKANDSIEVGRVFGTPFEHDGALVIPVATVAGGSGGGGGTGTGPGGEGTAAGDGPG